MATPLLLHFQPRIDGLRSFGSEGRRRAVSQSINNNNHHHTMKSILLASSVLVLFCVAGCKPTTQKAAVPSEKTTTQQLDKAQAATKDVAAQMRDYNFAQRNEYVAAMQLQLDAINRDLDLLSAQVEKSTSPTKAESTSRIKALRGQTAALSKQLDQAKNATESTWDEIKAGFNKGFTELKDGFNQARQWTSEKIAP